MLLLLFQVGENWYAVDTKKVIEVIPMVLLRKIESAPDFVAGVFNYHGQIVPVIDLCRFIRGESSQTRYSTRVVLVNYSVDSGWPDDSASQGYLGLLAERVTETLKVSSEQFTAPELFEESSYPRELMIDERGVIEKVNWERFVAEAHQVALLAGGKVQVNGAERN